MRLSQKKNCNNCRAINEFEGRCDLGFDVKRAPAIHNYPVDDYVPAEKCYKPKTNAEWSEAFDLRSKERNELL